jgi:serine protease Do
MTHGFGPAPVSATGDDRAARHSMSWLRRLAVLSLTGLLVLASAIPPLRAQTVPLEGFADLVERVGPAVVNIATTREQAQEQPDIPLPQFPPGSPFEEFFRDFFERDQPQQPQRPRRGASLGSGFVIDPEGFVVTNNHVIADADEITVQFADGGDYEATLIGRDPQTDLALLKIERDEPFPFVEWADSDQVRVGEWMLAIGNPFGLGTSVTAGIVSARGRDIRAGPYDDFFQVDAAINRGNSGGPSFTLEGQVFGVNTAIFSPSGGNVGIGFAIPSNLAKRVIDSLKTDGRVARGWLGVRIQAVTDEIAESLGLAEARGALVASVTPTGPAEGAGIEAGDVILEFNGQQITQMRSLPRIVAETDVGREVDVLLWRRGEEQTVRVTLGELPDETTLAEMGDTSEAPVSSALQIDSLGLTVDALSDELRSRFELPPEASGVVILDVEPGSPAEAEALRPGDLIVEVNQVEVGSPPEVLAKVNEAKNEGRSAVLLLIDRQGDLRFVALRLSS